ncbi:hypothetical protein [Kochikohdavirus PBEF19]|uniref:Uncharacterized protein n=1 Tax=Enterococcus phage PBEF129 TaxID=2696337 RepID=A0A7T3JE93_9CAUD|nr:hypothetical protein [Enterococcus phage PBEF129]
MFDAESSLTASTTSSSNRSAPSEKWLGTPLVWSNSDGSSSAVITFCTSLTPTYSVPSPVISILCSSKLRILPPKNTLPFLIVSFLSCSTYSIPVWMSPSLNMDSATLPKSP